MGLWIVIATLPTEVAVAGAIPGVSGALIAEQIPLVGERVIYEPSFSAVPRRLAAVAEPGDVILKRGIGNVYLRCPELLA